MRSAQLNRDPRGKFTPPIFFVFAAIFTHRLLDIACFTRSSKRKRRENQKSPPAFLPSIALVGDKMPLHTDHGASWHRYYYRYTSMIIIVIIIVSFLILLMFLTP